MAFDTVQKTGIFSKFTVETAADKTENIKLTVMMKRYFLLLICMLATIMTVAQKAALMPYTPYFKNGLNFWTQSFKNFHLRNFVPTDTFLFQRLPYGDINDLESFYILYKPLLYFSSDSSQFIDIYSYWLNLERQGDKIIARPSVDQGISLCNLKTRQWTRIFFCGSSLRIEDVFWTSDTDFVLIGTSQDDRNIYHPVIFTGCTHNQTLIGYSDSTAIGTGMNYISDKLKKLNIEDD